MTSNEEYTEASNKIETFIKTQYNDSITESAFKNIKYIYVLQHEAVLYFKDGKYDIAVKHIENAIKGYNKVVQMADTEILTNEQKKIYF